MAERQLNFGFDSADHRSVIYVASAISSLAGDGQEEVERECALIKLSVEAAAATMDAPWDLHVHAPCLESSPWKAPDIPPEQIFDDNIRIVSEDADALIVLGAFGGSLGAGQELAWASAVRLPVLLLHKKDQKVSRQVRGTPIDLEIVEFLSGRDLIQSVVDYIFRRRHAIETHSRQRRDRVVALQPLAQVLRQQWDRLDEAARREVRAIARLHVRRVEAMLDRPEALRAASLDEILALAGALGTDPGTHLSGQPLPHLSDEQLQGLKTAASEYDWEVAETLELMRDAQLELAKGGTRRFRLITAEDWYRFRESRRK
jgi:hypothetical protein